MEWEIQVRGAAISCFDDIICNYVIYWCMKVFSWTKFLYCLTSWCLLYVVLERVCVCLWFPLYWVLFVAHHYYDYYDYSFWFDMMFRVFFNIYDTLMIIIYYYYYYIAIIIIIIIIILFYYYFIIILIIIIVLFYWWFYYRYCCFIIIALFSHYFSLLFYFSNITVLLLLFHFIFIIFIFILIVSFY